MNPIKHLRDERGIALPVALAVLFVVAGLATVAVRAAITADHQTFRDRNAKAAIQAAVSGIQEAVYETNLMQPVASQCVTKDSNGQLTVGGVGGSGWCAATSEDLGNGASYTEQVSSGTTITVNSVTVVQRKVASTGTANGVVRRIRSNQTRGGGTRRVGLSSSPPQEQLSRPSENSPTEQNPRRSNV